VLSQNYQPLAQPVEEADGDLIYSEVSQDLSLGKDGLQLHVENFFSDFGVVAVYEIKLSIENVGT